MRDIRPGLGQWGLQGGVCVLTKPCSPQGCSPEDQQDPLGGGSLALRRGTCSRMGSGGRWGTEHPEMHLPGHSRGCLCREGRGRHEAA